MRIKRGLFILEKTRFEVRKMITGKGKMIGLIFGTILMPMAVAGSIYAASNNPIKISKASTYSTVLNKDNAPTIEGGNATRVDDKNNVTWEYHNVQSYANGHVSLNHQGYFGISSTSSWGISLIKTITATFASNGNELWLLRSTDGIDWGEDCILKSGESVETSNNWRYVRFYNWSDTNTSIDITSVNIGYDCSQDVNTMEDVDWAKERNVISWSAGLDEPEQETVNLSPRSDNFGEAIRFNKQQGASTTYAIITFCETIKLEKIKYKKVEFDYYKQGMDPKKQAIFPSIQLHYKDDKGKITSVGGNQEYSSSKSNYKYTDLGEGWWHVEMAISSLAPTLMGYKVGNKWEDNPVNTSLDVNAVKLTVGTSIIDNLKIGSSSIPLGVYNNGYSFKTTDAKPYLVKLAWVGEFHSSTMDIVNLVNGKPDPESEPIAEQVPWDNIICKSPFYIKALSAGKIRVTIHLVIGYNRSSLDISSDITIPS